MNVYIGTSGELKNAYIGEYRVPWTNTILYRPLTSNANDASWNGNNGTAYGNTTFSSENGAYLEWTWVSSTNSRIAIPIIFPQVWTISWWYKFPVAISGSQSFWIYTDWSYSNRNLYLLFNASWWQLCLWNWSTSQDDYYPQFSLWTTWNNFVIARNGSTITYYLNWTQVWSKTYSYNPTSAWSNPIDLWIPAWWTSPYFASWYVKDYIIESKTWSLSDAQNYYNLTKSNYWL